MLKKTIFAQPIFAVQSNYETDCSFGHT